MVKPAITKKRAEEGCGRPLGSGYLQERHGLSQRRVAALMKLPTCTLRYRSRRPDDAGTRAWMKERAQERPRFGYRRLHVLLRREGMTINCKKATVR